jgi:hypothetical protein
MPELDHKNLVSLGEEDRDWPVPKLDPVDDHKDDDEDDEDIIAPVQKKRKRTTNNSFALDLENDTGGEVIIPPPAKRFQFTPNQEKGILIGVWKLSPEPIDARKHAVYGFIDAASKLRSRVWPEMKTGEELIEGYPSGPGQSMVAPNNIIYESHLASLTRPQIKEYVRIRSMAPNDESPEERRRAEAKATAEAIEMVGNEDIQPSGVSIVSPLRAAKVVTLNSPKRPKGILLGYWKDSWIVNEADKHAAYGILQDDERLRVKVVKETRDGRPVSEPIPNSVWISYEQVVLEPHLANLLRTEVREYVRCRQVDLLEGQPEPDRKATEEGAVRRAKAKVLANAQAAGIDISQYDASMNAGRIAKNEAMAAMRENDITQNQTSSKPPTLKVKAGPNLPDASIHAHGMSPNNTRKDAEPQTKAGSTEHKAKAVRSSKAESDARAERLRKERENKEAESRGDRPRRHSSEDARDKLIPGWSFVRSEKAGASEAGKMKPHRSEHVKGDSSRPDTHPSEERHKERHQQQQRKSLSTSTEPQGEIKKHNGVTYEMKDSGPFKNRLVGDRRELLVIDGEDYIEYRVIMKVQF